MIGKLVFLAAVLSLFAVGASTNFDEVVPESLVEMESSAHLDSTVNTLQGQFNKLQSQLKAGMKITPAVNQTITTMIGMVEDDIEPAIKNAHAADQRELEALMNVVSSTNTDFQILKTALESRATDIRNNTADQIKLAGEWATAAGEHTDAVTAYETAVKNKTDACCRFQVASEPQLEYTPAYAACDFKMHTGEECTSTAVTALRSYVEKAFNDTGTEYDTEKTACEDGTTAVKNTGDTMTGTGSTCDNKKSGTEEEAKLVNDEKPTLVSEWATESGNYDTQFDEAKGNYTSREITVKGQEGDRKNEWASTQKIKCYLTKYKEGGSFGDVAGCESGIDTADLVLKPPTMVKKMTWELGEFDNLTDTTQTATDCSKAETADEEADKSCVIPAGKPKPECTNHELAPAPAPAVSDSGCCTKHKEGINRSGWSGCGARRSICSYKRRGSSICYGASTTGICATMKRNAAFHKYVDCDKC